MTEKRITVIGGGLAGCEAAWQATKAGLAVTVHEMKPERFSPAHKLAGLAELVCSNSLKATGEATSSGLLKEEMRLMGSLVVRAAEATRVPAGGTLAVDREGFSRFITEELEGAGVEVVRKEVTEVPEDRPLVIATGPLTSDAFAERVMELVGAERLFFYDAVAPIVYRDSIDMETCFMASRYDKGGADYINCPLTREEYERFMEMLLAADTIEGREFDKVTYFEGCMPIEELARRGRDTPAYGPMKPVGLTDPRTGRRPHAVVQLRRDNAEGTLYNMVGFQTRLSYGEQKRVFRAIPGLENAEFARLGKIHRNTYISSPGVLTPALEMERSEGVFFAGQITGVEGYCESSMTGIIAGMNAARRLAGLPAAAPPPTTMSGALLGYVSGGGAGGDFQPMNANFGLIPELPEGATRGVRRRERKALRKKLMAERAFEDLKRWLDDLSCK